MIQLPSGRILLQRVFRFWSRTEPGAGPASETLIVRRGLSPAYYFYLQKFAVANNVELVQDRRVDDRRHWPLRVGAERRNNDRRSPAPATWATGDVVVIRPQATATEGTTGRVFETS